MSDTPRTDEKLVDRIHLSEIITDCVPVDFARQLERENAEFRRMLEAIMPEEKLLPRTCQMIREALAKAESK